MFNTGNNNNNKNNKNHRNYFIMSLVVGVIVLGFGFVFFKSAFVKASFPSEKESPSEVTPIEPITYSHVQKVFNSRCIACHSCYESPCQLNLQSYEGLQRGVLSTDIFDRLRVSEIPPTRLYEDATSIQRWRELGFQDVIGENTSSVLLNAVKSGANSKRIVLPNHYPEQRQCIHTQSENLAEHMNDPRLAMPFNLPGLSSQEVQTIEAWVKEGAKPPMENEESVPSNIEKKTISHWEKFLNASPLGQKYKYKLTSRYLYEHLFLAHLYIKGNESATPKFYRLIRSKTACAEPELITTRTPGVDPGVENFYYCIVPYLGVVVNKNHLPYEISIAKLEWIKKLFIDPHWERESDETPFPPYQITGDQLRPSDKESDPISLADLRIKKEGVSFQNIAADYRNLMGKWKKRSELKKQEQDRIEKRIEKNNQASNPFVIFKDIPQESRYRFLLEDSYYHIMTFMKGTVCNGTMAVNAIQDQTYVLFIDPNVDLKLNTPDLLEKHHFPGRYGKETGYLVINSYIQQAEDYNNAREVLNANLKKHYKDGLPLNIIWNGDKNEKNNNGLVFTASNPNALLTVFRHDTSASIVRGPVGDLSKTVLLMDYATIERMAYDLVINFDVFGSLGHMLLTRSYMGLIRTDAENLYLSLLPPEQRLQLKKGWYNDTVTVADLKTLNKDILSGLVGALLEKADLTSKQQNILYEEDKITDIPQKMIAFENPNASPEQVHLSLMQKVLNYLGPKIVGQGDSINWTKLKLLEGGVQGPSLSSIEARLSELTREVTDTKFPFLYHFPEMSILVLGTENSPENNQSAGDQNKVSSSSSHSRTYKKFYSLLLNRQFNSISLMAGENYRRLPEKETLTLSPKMIGYYPNQFFYINESEADINQFVDQALKIKTKDDYENFLNTYGIKRMDPEIWKIYDFVVEKYREQEPIEAGYLDLSRYN